MPLTPVTPQCLQWRWMQAETRMQTENWWAGRSHPWKRGDRVLGKLLPLFKALGINKIRECATWRSWKVSCADVSYSRLDGENSSSDSQSLTLQIWMRCSRHKRNSKYCAAGLTRNGTGYRECLRLTEKVALHVGYENLLLKHFYIFNECIYGPASLHLRE